MGTALQSPGRDPRRTVVSEWKALVFMKRTENAPSVADGIRASRIQREGFSSDMCNEAHHEEVLKRFRDPDSNCCGFGCPRHRR